MEIKNIKFKGGALIPEVLPFSYEFGGMTPLDEKLLFPDGRITEFLAPKKFQQVGTFFDTWGCVSSSIRKGIEALIHRQLPSWLPGNRKWFLDEVYRDHYPYLSDRDLVVLSGTIPGRGNTGNKVLATAKREGMVREDLAPWDMNNPNPTENTSVKYYLYGRTAEAQAFAEEFNKRVEIVGEWVPSARWGDAVKYGILQAYVNAWYRDENGEYYNPTDRINHAVLIEDHANRRISDTYNPFTKVIRSWDDVYPLALKINLIEIYMEKPNILNNSLVILVEGVGGIGLFLDGKIIVDNEAKINSVFMARNSKNNFFSGGPTISLTQAQWDMFPKIDLSGKSIY